MMVIAQDYRPLPSQLLTPAPLRVMRCNAMAKQKADFYSNADFHIGAKYNAAKEMIQMKLRGGMLGGGLIVTQ